MFDHAVMVDHLKLVTATASPAAAATFEMLVVPSLGSSMNNMHGGAVALVYDMCTTMCSAPLSRRDFWLFGGVSRNLSVTFLRPVKVGTWITIDCEVMQIGKRLGES
jgi:acyl-coenzyme A thioesterase 13